MQKLSVALAVRNEEVNISKCLDSVKDIADEIVVVDEESTDKTVEIAKKHNAKVFTEPHHEIFHITKQKAIDKSTGDWILQLDADEVVTPELALEIKEVLNGTHKTVSNDLFARHQRVVEARDPAFAKSSGGRSGPVVAFFIPRLNMFLGKPLIHAGVYPDAVIRLLKKGKAHLPGKSVHEQMVVDGQVSWLFNNLEHNDSPTLRRYLQRLDRYTDLNVSEFEQKKFAKNIFVLIFYSTLKPIFVFLKLFVRHKGFLDGIPGFLWSAFSALHFPIAYFKYWIRYNNKV